MDHGYQTCRLTLTCIPTRTLGPLVTLTPPGDCDFHFTIPCRSIRGWIVFRFMTLQDTPGQNFGFQISRRRTFRNIKRAKSLINYQCNFITAYRERQDAYYPSIC